MTKRNGKYELEVEVAKGKAQYELEVEAAKKKIRGDHELVLDVANQRAP